MDHGAGEADWVQRTTRLMASVGLSVLLVIGAGGNAEASAQSVARNVRLVAAIPPPGLTLFSLRRRTVRLPRAATPRTTGTEEMHDSWR